jgi:hypothetical protein
MDIFFSIYTFVLFFAMTPGILLKVPFKRSKMIVGLVHGFLFSIIFYISTFILQNKLIEGITLNLSDEDKENYQKFFLNVPDANAANRVALFSFWNNLYILYKNKYPDNDVIKKIIKVLKDGNDEGAMHFRNIITEGEAFKIEELIMKKDALPKSNDDVNYDYIVEIKGELNYTIDQINKKMEINDGGALSNLEIDKQNDFLQSSFPELKFNM